jgi:hypothetical protein
MHYRTGPAASEWPIKHVVVKEDSPPFDICIFLSDMCNGSFMSPDVEIYVMILNGFPDLGE